MTGFPDRLLALLAPQERFERLCGNAILRAGRSLCDLSYANPYDGVAPEIRAILQGALAAERTLDLQYTPYGGATLARRAIAEKLSVSHAQPFRWRDVVMTPGAMAALCVAFRCIETDGGDDEVLIITPCWLDYPLYLENLGIRWRGVPLTAEHRLDIPAIRAALGPNTRAVLLSQPANPTGHLYSIEELDALAQLLREQPAPPLWISDECHRDIVFTGRTFVSPTSVYDRTCIVYSFGKSLFMQGQRIGYLAVSAAMPDGRAFANRALQAVRAMGFSTPNALMQIALPKLLDLHLDISWIERRSRRLAAGLERAGYSVARADGTFFLYVAAPQDDDFSFAETMAQQGVLIMPSSLFHQPGHFRLSVTATDTMVDRALLKFAQVQQVEA